MGQAKLTEESAAAQLISKQITELGDWRGATFARLRKIVREAGPGLTEEWKWGTGVWTQKGNVVAIGAFRDYLKLNFFKGAALDDPQGLFNAGLDSKATRSFDLFEGHKVNASALADLIRAAVALNSPGKKK